MSHTPHILMLDSGLGGLSVYNHIHARRPDISVTYIADNAFQPYGNKPADVVISRILTLCQEQIKTQKIDAIVIACNTASTVCLESLRATCDIPVIGTVPAIKLASKLSKSKHIGLLATPATIASNYVQELKESFAKDHQLTSIGSADLVRIAEDSLKGKPVNLRHLKRILAPFNTVKPDVIILGCTHFPLIAEHLKTALSYTPKLIDSGCAIAKRLNDVVPQVGTSIGNRQFISTGEVSPPPLFTSLDGDVKR